MNKIKLLSIMVVLLTPLFVQAQTQRGYVKTLGRSNQKGKALSGVTIRTKGAHNAVLSNAQGSFSIPMTGKKNGDAYSLQQIQKQGYELNETGIIGRQYAFSEKVPLNIVMVSTKQLQEDKLRIENKAYEVAEKTYKSKLDLLEKQKKSKEITEENYRNQLRELQDKYAKYQSLIDELANHYAHVDYDNLNKKEREINQFIENGELERADALIKSMFDPVEVLKRNQDAFAKIDQQVRQAQRIQAEANEDMARILRQQEKDAEHLYQLYTIALARFDFSKAEFYIETRAQLDTMNYNWQFAVAEYCQNQKIYDKAEMYYNRTIALGRPLLENGSVDGFVVNLSLNNLAMIYSDNQQYNRSEKNYIEALNIAYRMAEEYPSLLDGEIALTKGNLAALYLHTNRMDECERLLKETQDIYRRLENEQSERYESSLAMTLNNYALLLHKKGLWHKSISIFEEALQRYSRQNHDNPRKIESNKADILLNMGNAYKELDNLSCSKECFEKALSIYRELAIKEPQIYLIEVARALNNLANIYKREKNYQECEKYYTEAYRLHTELFKQTPIEIEPDYARTAQNLGETYFNLKKFPESETYYNKALDIRRRLYARNPKVYQSDIANNLFVLGCTIQMKGEIKQAIPYLEEAIQFYRQIKGEKRFYIYALDLIGQLHSTLNNNVKAYEYYEELLPLLKNAYLENPIEWGEEYVTALGNLAFFSIFKKKYEKAEKYARLGLKLNASETWIKTTLAAALLFQGKYAEAETVYLRYREKYKEGFLGDFKLYEENGVIPSIYESDVEKIKRMLNE